MLSIFQLVNAQAPQAFKYQSIVRNSCGNPLANENISIRATGHEGSSTGSVSYQESHELTTNQFGLINLEIGNGNSSSGDFPSINWNSGTKWIEIEADFGSGFVSMGSSQLLSVPYALNFVPGPAGPAGLNGVGIISTVDNFNGTFTFTYTDNSTFTTSDLTGPMGLTGSTGTNGSIGLTGATGNGIVSTTNIFDGTYTFTYTDNSTFTTSDLTGPMGLTGLTGTNGSTGLTVATGNGIVSTTNNFDGTYTFTYTDNSTFTTSDLTGLAGTNGTNGTNGIDGVNGVDGQDSLDGAIGIAGTNGTNGTNGIDGVNGVDGQDGLDGATGATGSISEFAMFFGLTAGTGNLSPTDYPATIAVKTVPGSGRFSFPRNGPTAGIVRIDNTSFTLPCIGTYEPQFDY